MKILQFRSVQEITRPKISSICMHIFLIALPIGIEHTPRDSSKVNLDVSFGHGNYAYIVQGCEDPLPEKKDQVKFRDIGLQVDYLIAPPFRIGVRGSYIFDQKIVFPDSMESFETALISPFINLEWRYFAVGVGYLYSTGGLALPTSESLSYRIDNDRIKPKVNFFLRIGDMRQLYLSTSLYHSIPVYSSGYLQLGVGGAPHSRFNLWAGIGFGPYPDLNGIGIGRIGLNINRYLALNLSAGFGKAAGISQNSFNVGMKLSIP